MKISPLPVLLICLVFCITKANAQIGNPAPNFTVTDTHGNTHTLYDYLDAGHIVVLDFFYTTCTPCQFYSPQVNLAYAKYGCNTQDVLFMSIDHNDTNAEVLAYDEEYNIEYPSVSGLEGGGNAVVSAYGILGFPTFYVIDSSRTIIEQIDPPTLQVFDFRFDQHGILPAECTTSHLPPTGTISDLRIIPNPVDANEIRIEWPARVNGSYRYEITDGTGKMVVATSGNGVDQDVLIVPLPELSSGVYSVRVVAAGSSRMYAGRFIRL